jgi:Sugar phosphate permease
MNKGNQSKFFYGWVVVAACFLLTFSFGFFYSYGAFFKELTTEFGWSRAAASTAVSVNTIFYVIGSIIIGWLSDRYKLRWIALGAAILYGVGLALCSQIHALWQLYIFFGVMAGFALGIAYTPPTATVQRWFVKRRGLTLGIALAGIGIGTFIMTPVAARFITTYGWRTSYILMGIIVFVVLAIAAFFIVRNPEDKGLKPYGVTEESINEPSASTSTERVWTAKEALKTKPFWMAWLMWLFFLFLYL